MWPLTFYVKSLPPNVGGEARGPVIRILEKYRNDRGIYEHEVEHVQQWFVGAFVGAALIALLWHFYPVFDKSLAVLGMATHPLLYSLVPRYKLWCEVQAYREQAKHYEDDRRPLFAQFIARNYGLKVTAAEALSMLNKEA